MSTQAEGRRPLKIVPNTEYVTFMLDTINERMKSQASDLYERECGVNLRELRLLRFIGTEPGLTLKRLIENASIEKTLASKAITSLVKRQLVMRSIGTEDARQICLHLTDPGVAAVMSAEPIGRLAESTFRASLSDEEHAVFRRCLHTLVDSCDEIMAKVEQHLKRSVARRAA